MKHAVCSLVCVYLLLGLATAHSWLQCTDYAQENGRIFSPPDCRAWPRNYASVFNNDGSIAAWGADRGYNYQPNAGGACRAPPTGNDYTAAFPMATYNPGQRVCLAWPPKNHVAANCNNKNIGDAGTAIYRSGVNPSSDPSLAEFHKNLVHDFGANQGTNGDGFQNCPKFCDQPDKALCTGCFVIPKDLALGKYTFLWEWAFNGPNDVYTSCYEVQIVADSGKYITQTYTKVSPDDYLQLEKSGAADTPTQNSAPEYTADGSSKDGSGMSAGGKAVLALFIIALVGAVVGSILFVKLGYGTIDTKFPFYHKTARQADSGRRNANYVAFTE